MTERPPKKPYVKSDVAEIDRRINSVFELLCQGEDSAGILQYAAKEWGVTNRQGYTYLTRARKLLDEQLAEQRDSLLAQELALRNRIIRDAMRAGKPQIALNAADSRAKLFGLFDAGKAQAIRALDEAIKDADEDGKVTAERLKEIRAIYGIYKED